MVKKCNIADGCISICLLVVLIGFVYLIYTSQKEGFSIKKHNLVKNIADEKLEERNFIFCSLNGCPHCENAKDEWEKVVKKNKTDVKLCLVERNDNPEFMEKLDIEGYPTFVVVDENGDKINEYNGPRNSKAMLLFINNIQ
jgi:thioredoxin-related protein